MLLLSQDLRKMTKFHLFSRDSVRLETAPTGGVRKSYIRKDTYTNR